VWSFILPGQLCWAPKDSATLLTHIFEHASYNVRAQKARCSPLRFHAPSLGHWSSAGDVVKQQLRGCCDSVAA